MLCVPSAFFLSTHLQAIYLVCFPKSTDIQIYILQRSCHFVLLCIEISLNYCKVNKIRYLYLKLLYNLAKHLLNNTFVSQMSVCIKPRILILLFNVKSAYWNDIICLDDLRTYHVLIRTDYVLNTTVGVLLQNTLRTHSVKMWTPRTALGVKNF